MKCYCIIIELNFSYFAHRIYYSIAIIFIIVNAVKLVELLPV